MKTGGNFLVQPVGSEPVFTREDFTEEMLEISSMVEDFVKGRLLPTREAIDKFDPELTRELFNEAAELGLLGIEVPEAYEGMDMGKVISALVAEKVGSSTSSFITTFLAHVGIGTLPLVWWGNEDLKKRYLTKLATGEWMGAYALTEPSAGSDALSVKTTAVLSEDGKHYILNGNKQFITNGSWAQLFTVFAKMDGEKFTAFMVERDTPGLIIGPEEKKMGIKGSSTTTVTLENVKIPVENLLGEIGRGHEIAFGVLNVGRFKMGAATLGGGKQGLKEAIRYAKERRQFGEPIAHFDAIKEKIADMCTALYGLDAMVYRTVYDTEEEAKKVPTDSPQYGKLMGKALEKFAIEDSIAKIFGSESLGFIADQGLQIHGGYGFTEEYPFATFYRNTRIDRIYEGTNEINRQIITGYFLKKALLEELPIREKLRNVPGILNEIDDRYYGDMLRREKQSLELAKHLTMLVLHEAICKFGQAMRTEHQLMEIIADMLIHLYLVDSALAKVSQRNEKAMPIAIQKKIVQTLTSESMYQISTLAMKGMTNLLDGESLKGTLEIVERFIRRMVVPRDLFTLKREIAEDIINKEEFNY
jgi:alkylation response protein AidB-like acyl-CoA dehydrogenase